MVKNSVDSYWLEILKSDAHRKTSLKYFNADVCMFDKSHPLWSNTPMSTREITKANIKCKILAGQYQLATTLSKRSGISDLCPLCSASTESVQHFLLECKALNEVRTNATVDLDGYLKSIKFYPTQDEYLQLLIDCSRLQLHRNGKIPNSALRVIESYP